MPTQQGVPAHYIKTSPVDHAGEFFSAIGEPIAIGKTLIQSPTFGTWALLELLDCDFVHPHKDATAWGASLAAFVAHRGKSCASMVRAHVASGMAGTEVDFSHATADRLTLSVMQWMVENEPTADDFIRLREWLMLSFAGFAMIPGGEGGSEQVFGMDAFGSIVAAIGGDMGATWDDLMWQVPLITVGHTIAQKSKQNGAKGIARPKDRNHMREMFDRAKECFDTGALYPWQEREPLRYGLDGHETLDEAYRFAVLQHESRMKRSGKNA